MLKNLEHIYYGELFCGPDRTNIVWVDFQTNFQILFGFFLLLYLCDSAVGVISQFIDLSSSIASRKAEEKGLVIRNGPMLSRTASGTPGF